MYNAIKQSEEETRYGLAAVEDSVWAAEEDLSRQLRQKVCSGREHVADIMFTQRQDSYIIASAGHIAGKTRSVHVDLRLLLLRPHFSQEILPPRKGRDPAAHQVPLW